MLDLGAVLEHVGPSNSVVRGETEGGVPDDVVEVLGEERIGERDVDGPDEEEARHDEPVLLQVVLRNVLCVVRCGRSE